MSDGYKVSIELELEDKFTSALTKAIEALDKAGEAMEKFTPGLKELVKLGEELGEKFEDAAKSAGEIFKGEGLAETVSRVENLAKHSEAFARSAQEAASAYARINKLPSLRHNGFHTGVSPSATKSAEKATAGEAAAEAGAAEGGLAEAAVAGAGRMVPIATLAVKAAKVLLDAGKEGIKTNFSMEDSNKSLLLNFNVPPDKMSEMMDRARDSEMNVSSEVKSVLNGDMGQIAEARNKRSAMVGHQSYEEFDGQSSLYEENAATISRRSGENFVELNATLAEAVKDAGVEGTEEVAAYLHALTMARLETRVGTDKMKETLHDMPNFMRSNKENLQDNMYFAAFAAKEGLADGKGGEMLNDLLEKKLPQELSGNTKADKERIDAGNRLGLYTDGQANFYQNGGVNVLSEMSALARAKKSMGEEEFNSLVTKVFGKNSELAESMIDWMKHASDGQIKEMIEMNHGQLNQNFLTDERKFKTGNESWAQAKTNFNSMSADITENASKGLSYGARGLALLSDVGADVAHAEGDRIIADPGGAMAEYAFRQALGKPPTVSSHEENAMSTDARRESAGASAASEAVKQPMSTAPRDIRDSGVQAAYMGGKAIESSHASDVSREAEAERQKSIAENYLSQMGQMLDSFAERIKPYVNAAVYVDGKEVASRLVSNYSMGTTSMNNSAAFGGFAQSSFGYMP
jgi:hypothetical protein